MITLDLDLKIEMTNAMKNAPHSEWLNLLEGLERVPCDCEQKWHFAGGCPLLDMPDPDEKGEM